MKQWFRRYRLSISSRLENVLDKVENHEAVIEAAIRDAREHAARARVKLNRVRRDGEKLRQRAEQLNADAEKWRERAVDSAEDDREKARECLRRRKHAQNEQARLAIEADEHHRIERQLGADLKRVEERVRELQRRRHTLAAREQRAEAAAITTEYDGGLLDDIEDVFDRWEGKLSETEMRADLDTDSFAESFAAQEDAADLDAELDELLGASKQPNQA